MKAVYVLSSFLLLMLLCGCSKDFLKNYDTRIIGTWRVADVNEIGFGGNTNSLPFKSGTFTFNENGSLTYVNSSNVDYKGSWEIIKKVTNEQTIHVLQITAIDFTTRQVLTEYYDDMNFKSTDHFTANVVSTFHTYVTHFKR